jgi:hypothetical protein
MTPLHAQIFRVLLALTTSHSRDVLDIQTSYFCRSRLQPERMCQHFARAIYPFLFTIQQPRVRSSRPLRMTHSNGRYRAYCLYLQTHLSCPTGYFRRIQQMDVNPLTTRISEFETHCSPLRSRKELAVPHQTHRIHRTGSSPMWSPRGTVDFEFRGSCCHAILQDKLQSNAIISEYNGASKQYRRQI